MQWHNLKEPLHYTTYHKMFIKWSKLNIFQNAYYILVKLAHSDNLLNLNNLFIDSSMIKNVRGVDCIGKNHYDRYRNGNKVTIVVTDKGIPIGMNLAKANIHDTKLVIDTLNDIQINRLDLVNLLINLL